MSDSVPDDLSELVGGVWFDVVNEEAVFVVELLEEVAGEHVVMYNYDKSPKFVSDFDSNEGFPEDDEVVDVVYVDSFPEDLDVDVEEVGLDRVEGWLDDRVVRSYPLPVSRLEVVPDG